MIMAAYVQYVPTCSSLRNFDQIEKIFLEDIYFVLNSSAKTTVLLTSRINTETS